GILYGVGVGPGDPELMTLKAVRLIEETDVIAVPGTVPEKSTAYKIALGAVPALASKQLLPIYTPMKNDRAAIKAEHKKNAQKVEKYLSAGKNVVYITLGDPTVYSTYSYLQKIIAADGFDTRYISGVTSFCAAAAQLGTPLSEWDEPLHIIPALHKKDKGFIEDGNYVLMKSGKEIPAVKKMLKKEGLSVCAVENCGMDSQKIYRDLDEIPDDAGYFLLVIAKRQP
ncbi:MAG: precorrin-2 C(20)-methyltransferase, partial [Firmicutes bacterium]|nr:precorrin-2 C(20)-methyltransferase [Bacillota bacterium]